MVFVALAAGKIREETSILSVYRLCIWVGNCPPKIS
jgi:hypothetical protein